MLAVDESGSTLPDASGILVDPDDTVGTTALAITDLYGNPFPSNEITSSGVGVLPGFRYSGYAVVDWVSGDFRMSIPSIDQVPLGGTAGQVLAKASGDSYDLVWIDPPVGGGGGVEPGTINFSDLNGSPTVDQSAAQGVAFIAKSGTTWPARPTSRADIMVMWVGKDPSPAIVDSGTGGMLRNVDVRFTTP